MNLPLALSLDDVLLVPQRSEIDARSQVDLKTEITSGFSLGIPLISINMDTVTGVDMAIAMSQKGGLSFFPRFDPPNVQANKIAQVKKTGQKVAAALGLRDDAMERATLCVKAGVDMLTVDVAHGHMKKTIDFTTELKDRKSVV